MRVLFRPEAEEELIEAIDWHEVRSPGSDWGLIRFGVSTHASSELLATRNPTPVVHRKTRMALVRRFPYLLLYRIADEGISVIAVFHAKRDPQIWQSR